MSDLKITVRKHYGFDLIFEAENIRVVEDIESREYPKNEKGETIINLNPKRDIKTEALDMFTQVLDDMIYYRESEYDSSGLIENLFNKLPESKAIEMLEKLNKLYE